MRIRQIDEALAQRVREEEFDPADTVTVDIPLMLRLLEYAKEDAKTDMDLHYVVEHLIKLAGQSQTLSMKHYEQIVDIPR